MKTKLLIVFTFCAFNLFSQTNLVPNGGFESWINYTTLSDWTTENDVTQNTSNFTDGFMSAKLSLTYSTRAPKITTQVPLVAGTTYTIKFKYKYVTANYNGQHPISLKISQNGSATTLSSSTFATNNNWTVKETTFTPDQSMSYDLSFSLFSFDDAAFSVNIDAVQVYIKDTEQYTQIPDLNFENKLIALGIDYGVADGKVLTNDINKLTYLNVAYSSISDLTGIQDFTGLTYLDCTSNQLTTLNLPKSAALNTLVCSYNKLTALDVSANLGLKKLDCYTNQLTTLDVSQNTALTDLTLSYNKLSALDVSSNLALKSLHCFNNQLTTLDVSNNLALNSFYCSNNTITTLDVSSNLALTDLDCTKNKLTNIDISNNTALINFSVGANQLTTLNVSQNTALKSLVCYNNQLTTLDISNNPDLNYLYCLENKLTSLDVSKNVSLTTLHCYLNQITDLDVSKNVALKNFNCYGNELKSLDVSNNPSLTFLYCHSNLLTILDVSKNPKLTELNCSNNRLRNLNLKNGNNISLNMNYCRFYGNQYLDCIQVDDASYSTSFWTNAKDFHANYNQDCAPYTAIVDYFFEQKLVDLGIDTDGINGKVLTSNINTITEIDVSFSEITDLTGIEDFSALTKLFCGNNQLKNIDVSKNTALTYLKCDSNQLTNLDVSKNTSLVDLFCFSNQLTTLDVSHNSLLINLSAYNNQLTDLDVSTNTALIGLSCENNQLKSLNVKNGNNTILHFLNATNNPNLSCIQVDNVLYANSNWLTSKDSKASYNVDCTSYTLITDSNFEQKLIDLGIDTDGLNGKVTLSNIENITYLDLSNSNISDLTGIEKFTALTYLDCNSNNLSTIDVSQNKLLTQLNVSENTKLETIHCGNNNLTDLNLTNLTNLTLLDCSFTNLTQLDLSTNSKLETLYCNNAKLEYLDLSKNAFLKNINASANQLTTLDLSHNPILELIFIENNPLTSLNVQNGNNKNFIIPSKTGKNTGVPLYFTSFLKNAKLTCIQVDDANYANANWAHIKESTASYSSKCTLGTDSSIFNKVVMYPNPTKGKVHINNVSLNKATVYNSLGQLVKSFTLDTSNTDNTINLSGLPKGIYYVYLINGDAASAKKIIVE